MTRRNRKERRIASRYTAEFRVDYIHEGDYLISRTRDISADGLFMYTEHPPALGTTTTLRFFLEGLNNVEVKAQIVWINKAGQNQDAAGMAVRFVNVPDEIRRAILLAVNRIAVLDDADSLPTHH